MIIILCLGLSVKKFDSIRPYYDQEVHDVLINLSNNRRFLKTLLETDQYRYLKHIPFSRKILSVILKSKVKNINDIKSYQDLFEGVVLDVIDNTINEFSTDGLENLNPNKAYLFISNHRDITLDSALLNLILHQNKLGTTNNAVGNNLLSEKWASDLMRLNKSFIIDRSDKSKKDIYKSLFLASEFIFNSITEKHESIWIAQKQGRSKDGNDFTDPSVLKMIHLNGRKRIPLDEYLNNLNVIPVSISYEKDPNDLTKARELFLTDLNNEYIKEPKEDLISISEGIRGHKGNVSISIGSQLNFSTDSYDDAAKLITDKINELYKIHPTNIAAAIIQGKEIPVNDFSENDLDAAIIYLNERMENIADEIHPYFLDQYSNSLNT